MDGVTREGATICFEDTGKGTPPLLLIHDLGADHSSLHAEVESFRHEHRVVAVDLPGHGKSSTLRTTYTVADYAGDLAWLCYEVGLYHPVAVGRGTGAAIAIELAAASQDLLTAVVAIDLILLTAEARAAVQTVAEHLPRRSDRKGVQRLTRLAMAHSDPGQVERLVEVIAMRPDLVQTWVNSLIWDGAAALARCRMPVLLLELKAPRPGVEALVRICPDLRMASLALAHVTEVEEATWVKSSIGAFLATLRDSKAEDSRMPGLSGTQPTGK